MSDCRVCGMPVIVTGRDAEELERHPEWVPAGVVHFGCVEALRMPETPSSPPHNDPATIRQSTPAPQEGAS